MLAKNCKTDQKIPLIKNQKRERTGISPQQLSRTSRQVLRHPCNECFGNFPHLPFTLAHSVPYYSSSHAKGGDLC